MGTMETVERFMTHMMNPVTCMGSLTISMEMSILVSVVSIEEVART